MKIAIVSEYYYPLLGGISEHVHFFAKECANLGHEVTIITSEPLIKSNAHQPPSFENHTNVEIIRIGHGIPFYSNGSFANISFGIGVKRKLRKLLKNRNFDIVHIHSPAIPSLPIVTQLVSEAPNIGTFHTYFEKNALFALYKNIIQDAIGNLDGRIAVSKLCIESLTRHIRADFEIIPNGVDVEYFSKPQGQLNKYNDGKLNILFVGRLDPRNGLECLIKAYRQARKKNKNIRLIVIGDGPLRSYYKIIMKEDDDIHFEGYVNHLRPDYYLNCDIFCFPVQKASFGITILEAMAAGKPIICTDLPAFHDILGKDGQACRFIDPFAPEQFAEKLTELIEDKNLRQTMGEVGCKRVQRFSWPNVTRQVLDYYQKILANT